jgi:hypothetical protein
MVRVKLTELDRRTVVKIWDRVFLFNGFLYIPDVVADRYSVEGEKLTLKEVASILKKNWNKVPELFKKYALADCRVLSLRLLF